jgi:hypothetical protein
MTSLKEHPLKRRHFLPTDFLLVSECLHEGLFNDAGSCYDHTASVVS